MKVTMKLICLLFACLFLSFGFSQKDTANANYVYMKSPYCVIDTTLTLHKNKQFQLSDSTHLNYTFLSGTQTYIEVNLRTTICQCKDCSFVYNIIINITNLKDLSDFVLTNANTYWFSLNSWMMPLQENSFSGTMSLSDKNILILDIYKFIPGNAAMKYDAIKIIKELKS